MEVEIRIASVSTDNAKCDAHPGSSDFFAAHSFTTITFATTCIERRGDDAKIDRMLTLRGVVGPVALDGHFTELPAPLMASGPGSRRPPCWIAPPKA